ncbi:MAG: leucine-rich repeat domain-containing protein [Treponema sp.]|jgi:hypothetical protein|nr:leucine-rich repeat domain-containing protein [Treponema sp.]
MMKRKTAFWFNLIAIAVITACTQPYNAKSVFAARPLDDGKGIEITGFFGDKSIVRIPQRIQNLPVTRIGNGAFSNCTNLISITIPESVTSIGNSAFKFCFSLAAITIPNSVTGIGYGVFSACTSLTSVTIPESVTSIGYGAFSFCINLTSVIIPESVISIGNQAFNSCTSLISITIPESVTSIGEGAFTVCTSLTSVTFEGTVSSDNFGLIINGDFYSPFNGDLRDKYLAGGIGTYTRSGSHPNYTWTKK